MQIISITIIRQRCHKISSDYSKNEENGLLIAVRQEWVKKLENNLYEIRSKRVSNIQRALYFQIQGTDYLITNDFTKKAQKTPKSEKRIARSLRSQYLNKEDN